MVKIIVEKVNLSTSNEREVLHDSCKYKGAYTILHYNAAQSDNKLNSFYILPVVDQDV